jgi:hypothetical protein
MAQQNLVLGTVDNDGTGEGLRDALTKVEANFTELYTGVAPPQLVKLLDTFGFGTYTDGEVTVPTISVGTTFVKLTIDGAGATSNSSYLPLAIRGSSELWNTTTNKIDAVNAGDGYTMRLDLEVSAKTGVPTQLSLVLDIGTTGAPTIVIVSIDYPVAKTPPFSISVGFPIFSLATFKANSGQIFLKADTGTLTIASRQITIHRISNGTI